MLNLIKQISNKPRVAGTKRNHEIANILIKKFKKLNYKIIEQKFPFIGWENIQKPKLKINGKDVKCLPVVWKIGRASCRERV